MPAYRLAPFMKRGTGLALVLEKTGGVGLVSWEEDDNVCSEFQRHTEGGGDTISHVSLFI